MNIEKEMADGTLTAELAYLFNVTKAKIINEGQEINLPNTDVKQKRVQIDTICEINGTTHNIRCWLPLRNQDRLILGTIWGAETQKWVGKNVRLRAEQYGSQHRLKVWPL